MPPRNHLSPAAGATASWLARLRTVARGLLVAQRAGWLVAWVLALLLSAGILDYILRTPGWFRAGVWVFGIVALISVVRRMILPAARFSPPLTEIALRVESSKAGREAGLTGVLASALELSHVDPAGTGAALSQPVITRAREQLGAVKLATMLAPARTLRSAGFAGLAIAAVAAAVAFQPVLTAIGAERLLWPFADAQWPKRTGVADVTGVKVHPLGSALALRAAVTKTPTSADQTRVAAHYRTIAGGPGGIAGPERRVLLTNQDKPVALGAASRDGSSSGFLFERLLEPSGLGAERASATDSAAKAPEDLVFEYWFETDDDRTQPVRVLLVEPPQVLTASATVELPDYARTLLERFPDLAKSNGTLELGPGSDDRASPAPILAGSDVTLTIRFNRALPSISGSTPEWIARSLGADVADMFERTPAGAANKPSIRADGAEWTLSWRLEEPLRVTVKATDEHGIAGVEEAAFRFDALKDNPPSAIITTPTEDKAVLPTAIVQLGGEGRDDVGLVSVGLERQLARKKQGSEGAAPEPIDERTELSRVTAAATPVRGTDGLPNSDTRRLVVTHTLDLSTIDLQPGDELWITAAATDAYDLGGVRHEIVRSGVRKLRIMSREELTQQIWNELSGVRRAAMKIDEDQRELNKGVSQADKWNPDQARRSQRAQAGMTERLAKQGEAISRVEDRMRENGLTDQALRDVLSQAQNSLARAGEQSGQATEQLDKSASEASKDPGNPRAGQKEREQADQTQQQVREELRNLIDLLDQGEDTYSAKRALEQLLAEQKALREQTQQQGGKSLGKTTDQLTPQEKESLNQIAQQQKAAAEKLREATDKMLEREEKLRKSDPAGAQAMADAARKSQRDQTPEKMEQASQQVKQNQTSQAQQAQSQAIQSLEQMLQQFDQAGKNRDEVLRRFLASLMDSIRTLIAQQETQLTALTAATPAGAFAGLDAGMVKLHQNTLGVLDEAENGPRDTERVAALLDRAADAQSAAAVGLRDAPVNADEVESQEQLSLDKLNEALKLAEESDKEAEQRQQNRKRDELRKRYQAALVEQISLRDSAQGLVGAEANRRNKATARGLGTDQTKLRETLGAIKADTKEVADAKVFEYAHKRLEDLTQAAAEPLLAGEATVEGVRRQTSAARVLQMLVDALDRGKKDDKDFRERENNSGGGGGGSGKQPLVPPAAEIKVLRAMQQEAADLTREVADTGKPDPAGAGEVARLQRDLAEQASSLLERLSKRERPTPDEPSAPEPSKRDPGTEPKPESPVPPAPEPMEP